MYKKGVCHGNSIIGVLRYFINLDGFRPNNEIHELKILKKDIKKELKS